MGGHKDLSRSLPRLRRNVCVRVRVACQSHIQFDYRDVANDQPLTCSHLQSKHLCWNNLPIIASSLVTMASHSKAMKSAGGKNIIKVTKSATAMKSAVAKKPAGKSDIPGPPASKPTDVLQAATLAKLDGCDDKKVESFLAQMDDKDQ